VRRSTSPRVNAIDGGAPSRAQAKALSSGVSTIHIRGCGMPAAIAISSPAFWRRRKGIIGGSRVGADDPR